MQEVNSFFNVRNDKDLLRKQQEYQEVRHFGKAEKKKANLHQQLHHARLLASGESSVKLKCKSREEDLDRNQRISSKLRPQSSKVAPLRNLTAAALQAGPTVIVAANVGKNSLDRFRNSLYQNGLNVNLTQPTLQPKDKTLRTRPSSGMPPKSMRSQALRQRPLSGKASLVKGSIFQNTEYSKTNPASIYNIVDNECQEIASKSPAKHSQEDLSIQDDDASQDIIEQFEQKRKQQLAEKKEKFLPYIESVPELRPHKTRRGLSAKTLSIQSQSYRKGKKAAVGHPAT